MLRKILLATSTLGVILVLFLVYHLSTGGAVESEAEPVEVILAEKASGQLLEQFLIGEANYLDVLSTTQSQQRLQRDILSARLDLILIRIGLYLALAGDSDTHPQVFAVLDAHFLELLEGTEELPLPVELAPEIDTDE